MSRGQAVAEASPAEIVGVTVHHNGAAQDAVLAHQGDDTVGDHDVRHAIFISKDVTEVSSMPSFVVGASVVFLNRDKNTYLGYTYM